MAYRSANTPPGFFSSPEAHLHLDGGEIFATETLMKQVEQQWGLPLKVDEIHQWIAGPQRKVCPELYGHHTPQKGGIENFKCFSTAMVGKERSGIRDAIAFMLQKAAQFSRTSRGGNRITDWLARCSRKMARSARRKNRGNRAG